MNEKNINKLATHLILGLCLQGNEASHISEGAFLREALGKPLRVVAVVVDHVVVMHPFHLLYVGGDGGLVHPGRGRGTARGAGARPRAPVDGHIAEGSCEGSLRPVGLHSTSLRCPVLSIP